ncbi:hypothetical protein Pelo_11505 [Pelomyxa schiedti]|nr:hypothetical protein Pelo_11505 [Pelomyxa schiedti]
MGDVALVADDMCPRGSSAWVGKGRRMNTRPPFRVRDMATGNVVQTLMGSDWGGYSVKQATNGKWFVWPGHHTGLGSLTHKEGVIGITISRIADAQPDVASVTVKLGYECATQQLRLQEVGPK